MNNKEYRAYHDAKQRCTNINHQRYKDWGGRGIKFQFQDFNSFIGYLGSCPKEHSLDRINNNKDYCIGNVKWSTKSEQQLNKRVSKHNTNGITGVRQVAAKGLITKTYQAYIIKNKTFKQLYTGPDFFEACCARKSAEIYERSN